MTNSEADALLKKFVEHFVLRRIPPQRIPIAKGVLPTPMALQVHAHWMSLEALTFPPADVDKKRVWIAFIQAILWPLTGDLPDMFRGGK